jgi:hypothetical protein
MEAARESSKEQPITRKTEPLSSDSWQQDRDEKTNTTKVLLRSYLSDIFSDNAAYNRFNKIHVLSGDYGKRVGLRQGRWPTTHERERTGEEGA